MIFADTSAFYALADRDDRFNGDARTIFSALAKADASIVTTTYIVVETLALLQRRLGQAAAVGFVRAVLPLVDVAAFDRALHEAALELFIARNRRELSFVDCSSIIYIRHAGIARAFAFDPDFETFDIELLH